MFTISRSLQRLVQSRPFKAKLPFPIVILHNPCLFKTFPSKIPIRYSFSSFQQQRQNPRQFDEKEIALLTHLSQEQLAYASEIMQKYTHCEELTALTPEDVEWISLVFYGLANSFRTQGNLDKALRYLKDIEELSSKTGLKDTLLLAQSYLLHTNIHIDQKNWTEAQHYLNEVDHICRLFGDHDKEAKSLMLQAWCAFGNVYLENDHDKALELYNSVLERIEDVKEDAPPNVLMNAYQGTGIIYRSRRDIDKTIEAWTKGFETAIKYFGKESREACSFSNQMTKFLYKHNPLHKKAFKYAKNNAQIASKVFPKDSSEVASSQKTLGHLYIIHEDHTKAFTSFRKALKFYEKSPQDHANALCDIYLELMHIYRWRFDSQKVSSFLLKAKNVLFKTKDIEEVLAGKYFNWAQRIMIFENMLAQEAEEYCYKALELEKSFKSENKARIQQIYYTLGRLAFDKKDWKKAFELFKESEKSLDETKTDVSVTGALNTYLGSVCLYLDNFDEAEKYLKKVLQSSCTDVKQIALCSHNMGVVYEKRGMLQEALESYEMAVIYRKQMVQKDEHKITGDIIKIIEITDEIKEIQKI